MGGCACHGWVTSDAGWWGWYLARAAPHTPSLLQAPLAYPQALVLLLRYCALHCEG